MAEVKWIKITTDIFDDEKILLIESMPDAYAIITVWFKLLCMAGKQNNSGVFVMGQIAYTDKMLATIFRMKESTVQLALQTFEQFGMVRIIDGVITIPNWEKHQSLDKMEQAKEQTRMRVAKHREKQKLLAERNVTGNVTVTPSNADRIDIDKDKDKDKEKDIEGEKEEEKKKKTPRKPKEFIPPTFEEVEAYIKSRGNKIDAKDFFDYFNEGEWIDSNGKEVRSWKQKVITWENNRRDKDKAKSYGRTAEEKNAGYCFNPNEDDLSDLF